LRGGKILNQKLPEPYKTEIESRISEITEIVDEIWDLYEELHQNSDAVHLEYETIGVPDNDRLMIVIGKKPVVQKLFKGE